MRNIFCKLPVIALSLILTISGTSLSAQAIDPEKSASGRALSDATFIEANIKYDEDILFLTRKATERGTDERVKELAQLMSADHTEMIFRMQQLKTSGSASSTDRAPQEETYHRQAGELSTRLAGVSGENFDTVWVSNILTMHQAKYDELLQAKENVMNPQLKMAVTEAIPLVRKHLNQLKSIQKYLARMIIQKKREKEQEEKSKAR
jgi:predicted outer membrane protein